MIAIVVWIQTHYIYSPNHPLGEPSDLTNSRKKRKKKWGSFPIINDDFPFYDKFQNKIMVS
jgi:hypothetical protein